MTHKFTILSTLLAAVFYTTAATAQTFGVHVQSDIAGQGEVNLYQDSRLADIVNGITAVLAEQKAEAKPNDFSSRTGKRQKVRGYRVQMFWGGASRTDQLQAQRIGTQVTNVYPELRAYTSFESPHWRCRVGDFKTREEAASYLTRLRRLGQDAMIVRSEIFVFE